MNILNNIYERTLAENRRNIKFWEDYLHNLNSLNFTVYSEKLTVPILVPIGNKILFQGKLKHTNEVTVSLGADYFAKCSIQQAEILRQHRIKDAKSKLEMYYKEKEYLENQISFNNQNVYPITGQEIIEHCTEEEDRTWRATHREKVRLCKNNNVKEQQNSHKDIDDEVLWMRLEELELQEELDNELTGRSFEPDILNSNEIEDDSFIIKNDVINSSRSGNQINNPQIQEVINIVCDAEPSSKFDLLQQVIDRQKLLESKLSDLKNSEQALPNSERDMLTKLDEIEQLAELEDEMYRLDDILYEQLDDETDKSKIVEEIKPVSKPSLTFNLDTSFETLQLTFQHSKVEPSYESYDPNQGIQKPSDIYNAFSNLFLNETRSILKKSNNNSKTKDINKQENNEASFLGTYIENERNKIIIVKDILEKDASDNIITNNERPSSLFKKRRNLQKNLKLNDT